MAAHLQSCPRAHPRQQVLAGVMPCWMLPSSICRAAGAGVLRLDVCASNDLHSRLITSPLVLLQNSAHVCRSALWAPADESPGCAHILSAPPSPLALLSAAAQTTLIKACCKFPLWIAAPAVAAAFRGKVRAMTNGHAMLLSCCAHKEPSWSTAFCFSGTYPGANVRKAKVAPSPAREVEALVAAFDTLIFLMSHASGVQPAVECLARASGSCNTSASGSNTDRSASTTAQSRRRTYFSWRVCLQASHGIRSSGRPEQHIRNRL